MLDITEAIDNAQLTDEQKVLAIKAASVHPRLRKICIARLIGDKDYKVMEHSLNQMRKIIQKALLTKKIKSWANDDKLSMVQAVVLAVTDTPPSNNSNNDDDDDDGKQQKKLP